MTVLSAGDVRTIKTLRADREEFEAVDMGVDQTWVATRLQ